MKSNVYEYSNTYFHAQQQSGQQLLFPHCACCCVNPAEKKQTRRVVLKLQATSNCSDPVSELDKLWSCAKTDYRVFSCGHEIKELNKVKNM